MATNAKAGNPAVQGTTSKGTTVSNPSYVSDDKYTNILHKHVLHTINVY